MNDLDLILQKYQASFSAKEYTEENNDSDILMQAFGITPEMKRENKQYWGRELGKCWESLVIQSCKNMENFHPAQKFGRDEPFDLVVDKYAIDTKYRVGSGDSGTLKKFKQYGDLLKNKGYAPVFLFLREDNLPAAITACRVGGWTIYQGQESLDFIKNLSGVDLESYLINKANQFKVNR